MLDFFLRCKTKAAHGWCVLLSAVGREAAALFSACSCPCLPVSPLNWLLSINDAFKMNAWDKAAKSFLCQLWSGDCTARFVDIQTYPCAVVFAQSFLLV